MRLYWGPPQMCKILLTGKIPVISMRSVSLAKHWYSVTDCEISAGRFCNRENIQWYDENEEKRYIFFYTVLRAGKINWWKKNVTSLSDFFFSLSLNVPLCRLLIAIRFDSRRFVSALRRNRFYNFHVYKYVISFENSTFQIFA